MSAYLLQQEQALRGARVGRGGGGGGEGEGYSVNVRVWCEQYHWSEIQTRGLSLASV